MTTVPKARQRRRMILTCLECRNRKQKCDRGLPCLQCVARGTEELCHYEKFKANIGDQKQKLSESVSHKQSIEQSALLRHAHDYGYSNTDSLTSMGMLNQVIHDIDQDAVAGRQSSAATATLSGRIRAEYYGYVRRLPPKSLCDVLFYYYFKGFNDINSAINEVIFREQIDEWWEVAHARLPHNGPDEIPSELRCYPALIFQAMAIGLQFLPLQYDLRLDDLKFGPHQTLAELSQEYSECGLAVAKLFDMAPQTLTGVQHNFLRDCWLMNAGQLLEAWKSSTITAKKAMSIGLHLEPETPSSSHPEELLRSVWANELRRRTWLNIFCWDSTMSVSLGRLASIDPKNMTVSLPIDCETPNNRFSQAPVPRSPTEKPTALTERLFRYQISTRFYELKELEKDGPIPKSAQKVRELHEFALRFRRNLPPFYHRSKPDTKWDLECPYLPMHRELIALTIDSFIIALHRTYIFTREESQYEVYNYTMMILNGQELLFESNRRAETNFNIGIVFPTFDAAVLLSVVLVSNPERYSAKFDRPYQCLNKAVERLKSIGESMPLAKTGAEILSATIRRVVEAQERHGYNMKDLLSDSVRSGTEPTTSSASASLTPESDSWRFKTNQTAMDWTDQNSRLRLSTLEVPVPWKELLLDEELPDLEPSAMHQSSVYTAAQADPYYANFDDMQWMDQGENQLWNYLAGYPPNDYEA